MVGERTESAKSRADLPRAHRAAVPTGDSESDLVVNLQQAISLTNGPVPEEERRETYLMKTVTKE